MVSAKVRRHHHVGVHDGDDKESQGRTLTWPERIESYRKVIGRAAHIDAGYEDGWA